MKKGYLYIGITTILFSTMEIVLKTVSNNFNPIQLTLERFFIGGLVLLPLAIKSLKKREVSITKEDVKQFTLLGFIGVVVSMIFYQLAVINTNASVVAVIFSCNPVFVMFFAFFILKEKIYKHNIISLMLEVIGIIIIINPLSSKLSSLGVTFTLLASLTFALYSVLGKKTTSKFGGEVVTCFSFILGSIEMFFLVLLSYIQPISNFFITNNLNNFANIPLSSGFNLDNLISIIYIFIFITGLGYASYFKAMEETCANTASLVFFFKPALSPILAFIFLKEIIPFNMIIGILLILSGSIFTILYNIKMDKSSINYVNHKNRIIAK